jgi:hypothetical protein
VWLGSPSPPPCVLVQGGDPVRVLGLHHFVLHLEVACDSIIEIQAHAERGRDARREHGHAQHASDVVTKLSHPQCAKQITSKTVTLAVKMKRLVLAPKDCSDYFSNKQTLDLSAPWLSHFAS